MTFNGTNYSSSTRRSIVEGDKANVTIKNNNSDKRLLFEIYEYDDNEEPNKLVEEHIIGKSGSYTMDEFQVFKDYYFKVTEYVAYAVDLYEIAEDDNLTYSFKAILDGVEKDIVSKNEYLGGSKIAITINNNTNQSLVLKITDEWGHKLYVKTISKNSTFIMPESEIITLDKNIRIYTELVVTHSVTISSSPEGVSYALNDNDGIGYEFGDNVREGYLIITVYNNTNYQVYAVAYKNVNDGVDNILLDPNETNSMYIEEFNCDLHIVAESCPDGKKFNITFEGSSSFKYALYDPYTSQKIDTTNGLDFWKEVNLEVSTLGVPEEYIVKVYDYRNVVKAVALFNYFDENEGEYLAFASFYIESDIRIVVEDRMDRMVIQAGYGFAHAGATYSATNEYGEPLEFEGRYLFVDNGQKINITISSPYCKFEVWGYYDDGEDEVEVIPYQTMSKGSTKTFTITVTHDFLIDGLQAH